MLSRRSRIQEKKTTRKGVFFLFISILLLIGIVFYGIPTLINVSNFLGNFKSDSNANSLDDKTPPAPPQFSQTPPMFSHEKQLILEGRSEADSTVFITINNINLSEIKINNASKFSSTINLTEGDNSIVLTAKDKLGNKSAPSQTYHILFDINAPELTISKPQDNESFYSPEQTIPIEGITEKEASLKINDRLIIVSLDGSFSQKFKLSEGENIFNIVALDKAENKTEKTIKVTYTP